MKVILYIGHHKVGSTALQSFLLRNWLTLLTEGKILYPMVEFEGMTDVLQRALQGRDVNRGATLNQQEPHNTLAFKLIEEAGGSKVPPFIDRPLAAFQMARGMRLQVKSLAPETVILCSEVMSNFAFVPGDLTQKLRKTWPDAEYEIYLTLRRPDEYIASWYGQCFRFSPHNGRRLEGDFAKSFVNTVHFDYEKLLKPWLQTFKGSKFHIRNYKDVLAAGGSCEDFTREVSVKFPRKLLAPERSNRSIPYAFYEIMRRATQAMPHPKVMALMRYLEKTPASAQVPRNAEVEVFGQEARSFLAEKFVPIHDHLNDVTGRSPFFPDIDEVGKPRPIAEMDAYKTALNALLSLPKRQQPDAEFMAFLEGLWKEL